jgi:hypothetical protein
MKRRSCHVSVERKVVNGGVKSARGMNMIEPLDCQEWDRRSQALHSPTEHPTCDDGSSQLPTRSEVCKPPSPRCKELLLTRGTDQRRGTYLKDAEGHELHTALEAEAAVLVGLRACGRQGYNALVRHAYMRALCLGNKPHRGGLNLRTNLTVAIYRPPSHYSQPAHSTVGLTATIKSSAPTHRQPPAGVAPGGTKRVQPALRPLPHTRTSCTTQSGSS